MREVYDELSHRDIPIELFFGKKLVRHKLSVTRSTLVVGYVETVLTALQQLGVPAPPTNDYPPVLVSLFHRRIWKSTLQWLHNWILEGSEAVFAKPDGRRKRFTGQVFRTVDDLQHTEGASRQTAIWCSEVVNWLSEYRVFVTHGEIVGMQHYAGDPTATVNQRTVEEAILLLGQSGDATAGYALDVGVLGDGTTALVEWNNGFSLGSYGLDKKVYTDLLIARWVELMQKSQPTTA